MRIYECSPHTNKGIGEWEAEGNALGRRGGEEKSSVMSKGTEA